MNLRMLCCPLFAVGLAAAGNCLAEYAGEIALPLSEPAGARTALPAGIRPPEGIASRIYLETRYDDALGRARLEAGLATGSESKSAGDLRLGLHCDLDRDERCRGYGATLSYGRLGLSLDPANAEQGASARLMWRSTLGF